VLWVVARAVGMPGWVTPAAAGLLALGLPVMLVTGRLERKRAVAMATGMYRASGEAPAAGLFTWRRAIVAGAIAFASLGLGAGAWATMRSLGVGPAGTLVSSGKLEAKSGVVVAEFENRTADSTLGPSVSEALRIDLSQSPVITVLGAQDMQQTLGRMGRTGARVTADLATEVAQRANAKRWAAAWCCWRASCRWPTAPSCSRSARRPTLPPICCRRSTGSRSGCASASASRSRGFATPSRSSR
jgi:hypothetical protein